jgi:hypothetical protein
MNKWQEIGKVGVDAGLMWVGDPCYCVTPDANSHPAQTWEEFCDILQEKDFYDNNYLEMKSGVVVSSGYGDGCYPVFVKKDKEGRVIGVMVLFDEPEEDDHSDDYESHGEDC